ncbi:t-SNARE affecting a late Golgi compartment protein 2 [Microbotryomycetes sp. JL221]|nr:t-SNARE affecting a late Golgi compartment protein 2 [Microbotryomycetes sp. JL221]
MSTLSTATNPTAPFTRSRTNLFLSYRDSAIRPSTSPYTLYDDEDDEDDINGLHNSVSESRGLLSDDTVVVDMRGAGLDSRRGSRTASGSTAARLPPKWIDVSDQVDDILDKVKPKIDRLDKLHAKHVLPGFKDRSAEEREIEALAHEITNDFRATQRHIKKIADMSKQLLATPTRNPEAKRLEMIMAANVQTALATKVQDMSGVFRKKQTAYLKQLRGHEGRGSITGLDSNKDPLAALADDEQYSYQAQQQTTTSLGIDVSQREQEIIQIAQSITDLSDLFKDLSSLVIDQGTLLDRVDWNVEQMNVDVGRAVEELKTATKHQRRSGKCQLIFLLVLLIIGCLIIIAYRPSRSPSPPATIESGSQDPAMDRLIIRGTEDASREEVAHQLRRRVNSRLLDARPTFVDLFELEK